MARQATRYTCNECGSLQAKWAGQCPDCGAWNTMSEQVSASDSAPKGLGSRRGKKLSTVPLRGETPSPPRMKSGIGEFDRATGGGLVPGSALLVGGDPGVGKSTLLMQVSAAISAQKSCLYISGEEAIDQLRLRAQRLGVDDAAVELAAATSVRDIVATLEGPGAPGLVIIDSIQTMYVDTVESAPGTVSQVRTSAHELIRLAKRAGVCVILVGHVTKEGTIAGPRVLEHMVDTVLYFEGERGHQFRILRAVKNRFGATDEIGVFEMGDTGLAEVGNPSALFLSDRDEAVSGASVFAGIEGTRPMLVEIQTLIASSQLATPRRAVVGWDGSRLAMVIAVLDARAGVQLGGADVYLNVAGGLRISEPAADLAVMASLLSSLSGHALPPQTVIFGEVGLSGEVRAVAHAEQRLKEAAKLGFTQALVPPRRKSRKEATDLGIDVVEIDHVSALVARFGSASDLRVVRNRQGQDDDWQAHFG